MLSERSVAQSQVELITQANKKTVMISIITVCRLIIEAGCYKPNPPSTSSSCPFCGCPSMIGIAFIMSVLTASIFKELS